LPEGLAWPPRKDDLERLYLVEKLSAAKIAKVYGLKYRNPKVAESTILYQLKMNGIKRRDPAEHIKRVTEEMVNDWVKRYQAGESLKRIAGIAFSPATVMLHLEERKINRRSRIDAQISAVTKYPRHHFSGTREDEAYLIGFARGDLNVSRHGRAIRIKTATTHPLMIEHLKWLFCPYGHALIRPRESEFAGFEWTFQVDLDESFSFLLEFRRTLPKWIFRGTHFLCFLAGFFDAEGSISLKENSLLRFEISLTNSDLELLETIMAKMRRLGFSLHLYRNKNSVYHLRVWRQDKVKELPKALPLRHPEKVSKARLALSRSRVITTGNYSGLVNKWDELIHSIKTGRDEFVHKAKEAMKSRSGN